VSQENVEVGRRFWALFNDRGAWWSLLGEEIEWHASADDPDADVYHGQQSVRRYAESWIETFPDIRLELVGESVDLGDHVITATHLVGKARTTGIEVREPYSFLFKISEHKIVHCREFHNNAEALEAVGLEE